MPPAWARPPAPARAGLGDTIFPKPPVRDYERVMGTNGAKMTVERSKAELCAWRAEAIGG